MREGISRAESVKTTCSNQIITCSIAVIIMCGNVVFGRKGVVVIVVVVVS